MTKNKGKNTTDFIQRHESVYQTFFSNHLETLGNLRIQPGKHVFILCCMDARVSPYDIFDLKIGESHVARNAGGIVTDDMIRSLLISQRLLNTNEIIVMHHLDCGMAKFNEQEVSDGIEDEIGQRPNFKLEFFTDADPVKNTRENVRRILNSPFVRNKINIYAALYVDYFSSSDPDHVALQKKYPKLNLGENKKGQVIEIDISDLIDAATKRSEK